MTNLSILNFNGLKAKFFNRYVLLLGLELSVLFVSLTFNYLIGVAFVGIIILALGYFYFLEHPFHLLLVVMFSLLVGSFGGLKTGGKTLDLSMVDLCYMFALGIILVRIILGWPDKTKLPKYAWTYLVFIFWTFIGTMLALDRMRALAGWHNHFFSFVSLVFSYNVVTNQKRRKLLVLALVAWGTFLACQQLFYVSQLGSLRQSLAMLIIQKNLMANSWGKSNYIAAFFVLIIPFVLFEVFDTAQVKRRIIMSIALVAMLTTMVLTLSRGGIISLIIALILFLLQTVKLKTLIPILTTIALVVLFFIYNPFTNVLTNRITDVNKTNSYFSRVNLYNDVGAVIVDQPITGIGFVNLGYYMKFHNKEGIRAHNLVLGLLGETGIIGAALYLFFMVSFVYRTLIAFFKVKEYHDHIFIWANFCALTGCLVHAMVEPTLDGLYFGVLFWIIFGAFLRYLDDVAHV